ncbi:MAG: inositol-1-monophosphatase [Candidatus Thiodiazotropha sp.]
MNPMLTIAVRAARDAGRVISRNFNRLDRLSVSDKGNNDFVTEVDRNAEAVIINQLREKFPNHAILAEESGKQGNDDHLWIIDPLDGTTNFLHGLPQFAVSIALKVKGRLEVGVVYDPVSEEMYTACRGEGAQLNDRKLRVSARKGLDGALLGTGLPYRDFRYTDNYMGMLKDLMRESAGVRRPGSAALDFAYVAAGRTDGFWELGLKEWDFAAGALLVREAGGLVTDIGGGERYLETGNVIAGNIKVHNAMLKRILPHLDSKLTA